MLFSLFFFNSIEERKERKKKRRNNIRVPAQQKGRTFDPIVKASTNSLNERKFVFFFCFLPWFNLLAVIYIYFSSSSLGLCKEALWHLGSFSLLSAVFTLRVLVVKIRLTWTALSFGRRPRIYTSPHLETYLTEEEFFFDHDCLFFFLSLFTLNELIRFKTITAN